jgi:hypothetical protein
MQFENFAEFYAYYLTQHRHRTSRRLHVIGTGCVIAVALYAVLARNPWALLLAPVVGYAFAWTGHYGFEKNRPATFGHPLWSLVSDFVMVGQVLRGRIPF